MTERANSRNDLGGSVAVIRVLKFAEDALCVEADSAEIPRLAHDAEQVEDKPHGDERRPVFPG